MYSTACGKPSRRQQRPPSVCASDLMRAACFEDLDEDLHRKE